MEHNGRKVVFKALVGSHNYNLNTEESDKDFKIFVLPTFSDLYDGKMYSNSKIGDTEDYDVHDIRKMPKLLYKSNINFMEVLFSNEYEINEELNKSWLIHDLFDIREYIARMNLPYLYSACMGMHYNKMKYLEKGTSGTQHLVEKYHYDTKQALHAYRILDFLDRYIVLGFDDFKTTIEYTDEEVEFMLSIKNGKFSKDEFLKMVEDKMNIIKPYERLYKLKKVNEELNRNVELNIKDFIKANL